MSAVRATPWDIILVGGGLANGLIAYRLAQTRPELCVLVLEGGATFGGNHTWSFHATDLTEAQRAWTAPIVAHRWPVYDVDFPGLHRRVDLEYCAATSDRLHAVLTQAAIPARFGTTVSTLTPTTVHLDNGDVLHAKAVIDGRGGEATPHLRLGWQKFLGLEVRTGQPHGLVGPILMDATVAQHDGYRFVYVLPFAIDRLLIEDTYYADGPGLDVPLLRARVESYAAARGWTIAQAIREETGVLPITLAGNVRAFWDDKHGLPCSGLRAGLFHPTTGYSWPDAVRLADHLAGLPDLTAAPLFDAIRRFAEARWRSQGMFRALNRMLFLAGSPAERWAVMRRFYRFPEPAIGRFYAGDLPLVDKVRLLAGKPPVPVGGAVRALMDFSVR